MLLTSQIFRSFTRTQQQLGGFSFTYPGQLINLQKYASQANPKTRPDDSIKGSINSRQYIEQLLNNDPSLSGHNDITVFIREKGRAFTYTKYKDEITRQANITKRAAVKPAPVKQAFYGATSIEDYLFNAPAPTQPFPGISKLPGIYLSLSKSRLTMLVVLTAMGGYAMAPGAFDLSTLMLLSVGTALQSAAANSTNQAMEVKYDTQMHRTRNRVLVRGLISREHAVAFAAVSGVVGTSILYWGVNPLTCYIGALNYLIYTAVYTPMKRQNTLNTWIGSVVGALPPIMGWAAATGYIESGGLWLGMILYIWQFPHFKALSWNIKGDYQRAGYQMSSVMNPDMCKRVAFRHTVFMTLACCLGPVVGTTTDMFIAYSLPCNIWGMYLGYRFYSDGDSKSSRNLFRFSLVQIPYLIMMMLISKNWQAETTSSKPTTTVHAVT